MVCVNVVLLHPVLVGSKYTKYKLLENHLLRQLNVVFIIILFQVSPKYFYVYLYKFKPIKNCKKVQKAKNVKRAKHHFFYFCLFGSFCIFVLQEGAKNTLRGGLCIMMRPSFASVSSYHFFRYVYSSRFFLCLGILPTFFPLFKYTPPIIFFA